MLLDPRLQLRLSADEFRAFINLTVWAVSLVSDGAFRPDDAEMMSNLTRDHIDRLAELGLVEHDDEGNYRIAADYWSWQTSRADLDKMDARRKKNRERQSDWRAKNHQSYDPHAEKDE